jgi:hypothetical protein
MKTLIKYLLVLVVMFSLTACATPIHSVRVEKDCVKDLFNVIVREAFSLGYRPSGDFENYGIMNLSRVGSGGGLSQHIQIKLTGNKERPVFTV